MPCRETCKQCHLRQVCSFRSLHISVAEVQHRMDAAIDQLEKVVLPSVSPLLCVYVHLTRLQQNEQSTGRLTSLIQVLLGMKPPSKPTHRVDNLAFFDDSLNDSQKTAVTFCLESPEVACIHGPPGRLIGKHPVSCLCRIRNWKNAHPHRDHTPTYNKKRREPRAKACACMRCIKLVRG